MKQETGQVLLAAAIILAIIVVGMVVVANGVGVDIASTAKNCTEIIYNSGVKGIVCQ